MEKRDTALPADGEIAAVPADGGKRRMTKRRILALVVGALVVLAIMAALIVPLVLTLQPSYYERYPDLQGRIQAWRTSTHAPFACADCHVDPGVDGLVSFATKSIPSFYSQLVSGPNPGNLLAVPDNVACLKCHVADRTVSPSGDLLIPHNTHVVKLGLTCAACHKNLVHSPNAKGFNTPEMGTCLAAKCHDGVAAKNDCVVCHTRKQVPDNHKKANWLDIHPTLVETIDCAKCHAWSPDYCDACHAQRPPSHAGNWKYLHQFRTASRGTKACLFCHDQQKFCNTCH